MTSSPPITAHLVLGEGGWELQPPGRYPGWPGGRLAGVTPALVPTELGQPGPGRDQDEGVKHKSGACDCKLRMHSIRFVQNYVSNEPKLSNRKPKILYKISGFLWWFLMTQKKFRF